MGLNRRTGARLWKLGMGSSFDRLLATPRALVAVSRNSGSGVALPMRLKHERAGISGHVRARCRPLAQVRVVVGDKWVPVDADGNFVAQIDRAGIVLVSGAGAGRPRRSERAFARVVLLGEGEYVVPDLTFDYCGRHLFIPEIL